MTQHYVGEKIVLAWPEAKDGKEGYAVKYEDGYVSWSPREVFDKAYISLGHIGHLQPHQQRVVAELAQLNEKIAKLEAFTAREDFEKIAGDEALILAYQLKYMKHYAEALGERVGLWPME
ncbi:hypothetical protein [Kosakonia phage Kc237]|nr:hypothetical protein [Kosakonia phage Kc237]